MTVLERGRRMALRLMSDTCTIRLPGSATWSDVTGTWTGALGAVVYSGPCRVQALDVGAAEAGEREWAVERVAVSVPVCGSEAVTVGCLVALTGCAEDAALAAATYRVAGLHRETNATARRLQCEAAR